MGSMRQEGQRIRPEPHRPRDLGKARYRWKHSNQASARGTARGIRETSRQGRGKAKARGQMG